MTEKTPLEDLPSKLMRIAEGALEEPADEAVVRDAADAIVRLRAENSTMRATLDGIRSAVNAWRSIDEQKEKIHMPGIDEMFEDNGQ